MRAHAQTGANASAIVRNGATLPMTKDQAVPLQVGDRVCPLSGGPALLVGKVGAAPAQPPPQPTQASIAVAAAPANAVKRRRDDDDDDDGFGQGAAPSQRARVDASNKVG